MFRKILPVLTAVCSLFCILFSCGSTAADPLPPFDLTEEELCRMSNYMGFGSGIVVDGTGISLQNRGSDFSLNPEDANRLEGGKRTYHTIIPGFLLNADGSPVGPFGVMGGYMQPQGHLQVVMNYVDFHLDPQQALDAPRWQWMRDHRIAVETRYDAHLAEALQRRGHDVYMDLGTPGFGRGQMIVRLDNGTLVGGTESRTDSNIACF